MLSLRTIPRRAPALALAATLLASALGPLPSPGVTASEEPAARLQVLVKQIVVKNDHDWHSEGDMTFTVDLFRCPAEPSWCPPDEQELLARSRTTFGANSGQTVTLDRLFPENDELIGSEESYAVVAGERYVLRMWMMDRDSPAAGFHDQLGRVVKGLTTKNGWGLGSYTEQSIGFDGGDFEITYEIRRAPMPDLRATSIKIHDLLGDTRKLVCMGVWNAGMADAGPFTIALHVDGLVPPGGSVSAGRLASGASGELCGEVTLPASGQHELWAVVDVWSAVAESNEANNRHVQQYTVQPAAAPNESTAEPEKAQADLTVSAIRVNGQARDGKGDCKDGKNDVTVVVKNSSTGKAEKFAVRLTVDGGEVVEETVAGLEAGQEHEVRFDDVRLKKGERTLTVLADAKGAVAESKEDNNERKVTARCQDDD
jgi:CARDB